jgi:hypothetical protein
MIDGEMLVASSAPLRVAGNDYSVVGAGFGCIGQIASCQSMVNTVGESLNAKEAGLAVARYVCHFSHVRGLHVLVCNVRPIQTNAVSHHFLCQVLLKLLAPSII